MLNTVLSVFLTMISLFTNLQGILSRPASPEGGVLLRYGNTPGQYMDVFLPDDVGNTADVVLAIHGGSWMFGDQRQFDEYARQAAEYGYVGVSVDHRKLTNNARAQGMNDDIFAAVSRLKSFLAEKGITAGKMIVAGHSSGAHLALLFSYTHHEDSPIPIAFVTACSAPSDLRLFVRGEQQNNNGYFLLTALANENITAATIDGDAAKTALAKVNPIDLVTPDVPPTILVHGDRDEVVSYENSTRLLEALRANGVDAELITYEGQGHFIRSASEEMQRQRLDLMLAWAEKYL